MARKEDHNPHTNFPFSSRILVIGGSSGLGFAVASATLASGSKVHISSFDPIKQTAAINHLKTTYPKSHVSGTPADLSNPETVEANIKALLNTAVETLNGPLDHVVYTAGDTINMTPLADTDVETALAPMTVRFLGPLLIAKHIAANPGRYIARNASSSIILTSGAAAHRPRPGITAAISVAGAVEALTKGLSVDLAPIRVNVVVPGAVLTENLERRGSAAVDAFTEKTLTKVLGKPEAAAEAYLFCMRCGLATGQSFIIDNGYMMVS